MDAADARLTEMGLYDKPYEASLVTDLAAGDAGALLRALGHIRMHFLYLAEKVQEHVRVQKDTEEAESATTSTVVLQQAEAERERKRVSRVCCAGQVKTSLQRRRSTRDGGQAQGGSVSADACSRAHGKLRRGGLVEGTARRTGDVLKAARFRPCVSCACSHAGFAAVCGTSMTAVETCRLAFAYHLTIMYRSFRVVC